MIDFKNARYNSNGSFDVDVQLENGGEWFPYTASDEGSPVMLALAQWFDENNPNITPYIPPPDPTPEEIREGMTPISKRQLRLTLVRNGISLSELDAAIDTMGDEAIIEWNDSSEYRRLNPLLNQVAEYLELSQEQVDAMWQQALEA